MNHSDLVNAVTERCDMPAVLIHRALTTAWREIQEALRNGDSVRIAGFGVFELKERAPRSGRNPKTGEAVDIPSKIAIKFRPGRPLVEAVNS